MPGPVSDTAPTLADKMRAYVSNHDDMDMLTAAELTSLADALDALDGSNIPKMVGTWAKARRRWCEITGEPLI